MRITGNAAACGAVLAFSLGLAGPASAMDASQTGSVQQSSQAIDFPSFFDGARLPSLQDIFSGGKSEREISAPYRLGAPAESHEPNAVGTVSAEPLNLDRTEAVISKSQAVRRRAEELSRRFNAEDAAEQAGDDQANLASNAIAAREAVQQAPAAIHEAAVRPSEPTNGERASRDMSKVIPGPALPIQAPSAKPQRAAVAKESIRNTPAVRTKTAAARPRPEVESAQRMPKSPEPEQEASVKGAIPTNLQAFGWDAQEVLK